jgi:hypothetical protein
VFCPLEKPLRLLVQAVKRFPLLSVGLAYHTLDYPIEGLLLAVKLFLLLTVEYVSYLSDVFTSMKAYLVDMHLETRILFSLYWLSSGFEADSG